jgi:hypothetical protein
MPSWHGQQTLYISTDGHFRWLINGGKNIFLPLNPEGKGQEIYNP